MSVKQIYQQLSENKDFNGHMRFKRLFGVIQRDIHGAIDLTKEGGALEELVHNLGGDDLIFKSIAKKLKDLDSLLMDLDMSVGVAQQAEEE